MIHAFNSTSCPPLAVPDEVMQAVVQAESGGNRFAIGVVGARLERQPRNLGEAIATARMLENNGYDFSLGIAQVNRSNLRRYGLDTFKQAFDACANLNAGARILAECFGRSGHDWGGAISCYYSGNFTTGYRDGYVQRILASLDAGSPDASGPITVHPQTTEHPAPHASAAVGHALSGSAAYRISIRSTATDAAEGALVAAVPERPDPAAPLASQSRPVTQNRPGAAAVAFIPRVSGPGDRPPSASAISTPAAGGYAAPDQETADAAFVF